MDKQELKEVLTEVLLSEEFVLKFVEAFRRGMIATEPCDLSAATPTEGAYVVDTETVFADKC